MKNQDLYQLFIDELEDMLSAENQIIAALPKLIKLAFDKSLKEALSEHLGETEQQVSRLKEIFSILGLKEKEKKCKGMRGILIEGDLMVENHVKSPVLDATIISVAQKVEHYEIASYGTLKSFANHLKLDKKVINLIQQNLDEEGSADKKLTKIADGSFFSSGINQKAADIEPGKD